MNIYIYIHLIRQHFEENPGTLQRTSERPLPNIKMGCIFHFPYQRFNMVGTGALLTVTNGFICGRTWTAYQPCHITSIL